MSHRPRAGLEAVVFDLGAVWLDGRADFSPSLMLGVAALRLGPCGPRLLQQPGRPQRQPVAGQHCREYAPKITRLILERVRRPSVPAPPQYGRGGKSPSAADRGSGEAGHEHEHRAPHRAPRGREEHLRFMDLVRAYGRFEITAGELGCTRSCKCRPAIAGYVKPLAGGSRRAPTARRLPRRGRVALGLAVVVPFRFQRRPTEDTAGRRGSQRLGLIPRGYVVLRSVGGRLGLHTNQLLCH